MHHVKQDKRSQSSANNIYQGLVRLLKHRPYESISISTLCEEANISRATFYRNFDIIEDVLTWYAEKLLRSIFVEYFSTPSIYENMRFNRFALTRGLQESEYIETIAKADKYYLLQNMLFQLLEKVPLNMESSVHGNALKYGLSAKIGSFFGVISCWISEGKKESIPELLKKLDEIDHVRKNISVDYEFLKKHYGSYK